MESGGRRQRRVVKIRKKDRGLSVGLLVGAEPDGARPIAQPATYGNLHTS